MTALVNYRIRVRGELPGKWSDRMGGMRVTIDRSRPLAPETILVGPLRDQAALAGVLASLCDLHFMVLSLETLPPPEKGDVSETE
jgi:hypothetical protein